MLVLITYDVNTEKEAGKRRLRKISKVCVNYGQRVQKSVFECMVDPGQYRELKGRLEELISEDDSIRFYNLGDRSKSRIETIGKADQYDPEEGYLDI